MSAKDMKIPTILLTALLATSLSAQDIAPVQPEALKKWRDARFGMFIHWGPVSLTGHEIGWSRGRETPIEEYDQLYKRFNPTKFNGGDGNLLFNVGPMPTGEIEARQVDRLREMGAWLAKNGEAIYGTRGGPWKPSSHIVSTRKDDRIYVHLLRKMDGTIRMPALPVAVKSARILHGPDIETSLKDQSFSLEIPAAAWDEIDTIVELTIDGDSMDIAPIDP